jgi:hypothetical protein
MKAKTLLISLSLILTCVFCYGQAPEITGGSKADRDSLARTSILIRAAFSRGDVDGIMKYHHPDVIKALSYKNYQRGANTVRSGIAETLKEYRLDFTGNDLESLYINGNTAVEQTLFTIQGTLKVADSRSPS